MSCKRCGQANCESIECKSNIFCEKCSTKLTDKYRCPNKECRFEKFFNPTPVAVPVIKVLDEKTGEIFLLGVKRGIKPVGGIAFPGGFQEIESAREAAVRELKEETGIILQPEDFEEECLVKSSSPISNRLLMFFRCKKTLNYSEINWDFKCRETISLELIKEGDELVFPLHTEVIPWGLK